MNWKIWLFFIWYKKHEATFRWKRTKIVRWKRWTIYSMIGIYLLFMLAGSLGSCLAHVWLAVRYSVWLDSCFCAKPVLVQIFLTSITLNSVRGLVRSFKTIKTKLISQCWLLACYMKIYSVFNPQYFPRSSLQETDKKKFEAQRILNCNFSKVRGKNKLWNDETIKFS